MKTVKEATSCAVCLEDFKPGSKAKVFHSLDCGLPLTPPLSRAIWSDPMPPFPARTHTNPHASERARCRLTRLLPSHPQACMLWPQASSIGVATCTPCRSCHAATHSILTALWSGSSAITNVPCVGFNSHPSRQRSTFRATRLQGTTQRARRVFTASISLEATNKFERRRSLATQPARCDCLAEGGAMVARAEGRCWPDGPPGCWPVTVSSHGPWQ